MDYGNLKVPENVTPEVQAILDRYEARNKEIENAHRKNTGRIWLGSALSGASAHPVFNIPYIGTGLGGALYELGQGITEGDKLPELAKRTGAGFAIGETVGAIPYAGKYANKLSGGKIGNALTAGVEKIASRPLGQKVTEIAPKVEDLLMTDIKAFNPNRQAVYHGSPYDFAKFSNEAIGTGEGAQAHGYGHYAALDKDTAYGYQSRLTKKQYTNDILNKKELSNLSDLTKENLKTNGKDFAIAELKDDIDYTTEWLATMRRKGELSPEREIKNAEYLNKIKAELETLQNFDATNYEPNPGQLYKLSIPKDDVMLREDLPFSQQPKAVQDALNKLGNEHPEYKLFNLYKGYNNSGKSLMEYLDSDLSGNSIWDNNVFEIMSNTPQKTSNILNNYGIKGISYNGGIDGEARVIFNPNDIEIVRKYYNQPSLGEMLLKKSPNAGATSNYLYDLMIRE